MALGLAVWAMAGRDLARMRAGLMDPAGREQTEGARAWGVLAVCVGAYGLVCFAPVFYEWLQQWVCGRVCDP